MNTTHTCLYCSSPCEVTLATSSEGCTNPKCRAFDKKSLRDQAKITPFTTGPVRTGSPLLHPDFHLGTRTGRLSSARPNIGGTPQSDARLYTEDGHVRELGEETHKILHKMYTHGFIVSRTYLEKYLGDHDIHTVVASQMFDVTPGHVTKTQRAAAKEVLLLEAHGDRGKKAWEKLVTSGLLPDDEALSRVALRSSQAQHPAEEWERRTPFRRGERLKHRWLGIRATVIQTRGPCVLKPDEEILGRTKGPQGELLREWQRFPERDVRGMDPAYVDHDEVVDKTEKNMLWWPNTMRVPTESVAEKQGQPLLGVLSLVSVSLAAQGLVATYDYITVQQPVSSRCRIKMVMGSGKGPLRGVPTNAVGALTSTNFECSAHYHDIVDHYDLHTIHMPRILAEFEDLYGRVDRKSRAATLGEKALFARLRRNHE